MRCVCCYVSGIVTNMGYSCSWIITYMGLLLCLELVYVWNNYISLHRSTSLYGKFYMSGYLVRGVL